MQHEAPNTMVMEREVSQDPGYWMLQWSSNASWYKKVQPHRVCRCWVCPRNPVKDPIDSETRITHCSNRLQLESKFIEDVHIVVQYLNIFKTVDSAAIIQLVKSRLISKTFQDCPHAMSYAQVGIIIKKTSKKIGKEYTLSVALLPDIFALVDSGKISAHSE